MDRLWVLSIGEYDDRYVERVFTSLEAAVIACWRDDWTWGNAGMWFSSEQMPALTLESVAVNAALDLPWPPPPIEPMHGPPRWTDMASYTTGDTRLTVQVALDREAERWSTPLFAGDDEDHDREE